MANIEIFKNERIGEIRTILDERNEPWFCLADVCKILGLGNPSQVKTTLKSRGVISNEVSTSIISQGVDTGKTKFVLMNFIDEPNLYKCIFQSRKNRIYASSTFCHIQQPHTFFIYMVRANRRVAS